MFKWILFIFYFYVLIGNPQQIIHFFLINFENFAPVGPLIQQNPKMKTNLSDTMETSCLETIEDMKTNLSDTMETSCLDTIEDRHNSMILKQ